jgi:hypothetical protein
LYFSLIKAFCQSENPSLLCLVLCLTFVNNFQFSFI